MNTNYEIKAKSSEEEQNIIRDYLNKKGTFIGTDHQIDTYFKVSKGRLKIRKGNIENKLIYYERDDGLESKQSRVLLIDLNKTESLEEIIREIHETLIEVEKKREIYFIENVKFHLDEVKNLGSYIEIEAIAKNNALPEKTIKGQCDYYKNIFHIKKSDLIRDSYSDMILKQKEVNK